MWIDKCLHIIEIKSLLCPRYFIILCVDVAVVATAAVCVHVCELNMHEIEHYVYFIIRFDLSEWESQLSPAKSKDSRSHLTPTAQQSL